MNGLRRKLLLLAMAAALPDARAQEPAWPARPVRLIVPGGPGGVVDLRARWLADRLAPALGQPLIVDNHPGAGGIIGTEMAARSAPDGYTLVIVHQGTMAINPYLYGHLGYDPIADFAPVTRVGFGPLMLAVNPGLPVQSVADLVRLAKSRPGQLSYGSPGIGTPPHLAGELFKRMAGIEVTHVPYKGGGQAVTDLMAGHIAFSIEGLTVQLPQVKAGKLRALGVTGAQRLTSLPDIPTIAEAAVPGYEYIGWVGLAAPAATPKPVIAKLYREAAKVLNSAEGREWFASFGAEPGGEPPEVFAAFIRAEYAKWGKVMHDAGITLK
ncbi:tripartite tricarboxylate transporter substrate binding protein [Cupriavidus sp. CV2]|uniref:Bug family tripartite tricarboxylate transporter substrate binding protein n=1 Tax=Cupriavidus ulmosensis TaxID=3065913 RepID=UPI00296AD601|nr:tripartite tricarboxylate transporter substrate binding protein [Cupriavidus sp. CV2]MDW3684455.1 tripartite tricarboxylate transporter substrate binding protein [Cupriavidus sp. CV2]